MPRLISRLIPPVKNIGLIGRYSINNLPPEVSGLISYGLTEVKPNGEIKPSPLLDSIEISDEGRIYLLKLAKEKKWHDDKKVIATDFNYKIKDSQISFEDDRTIKIKLKQPFAPLLAFFTKPFLRDLLIGTRDYRIKEVKKTGDTIDIIEIVHLESSTANPNLKFYFYRNENAAISAFKLGEIKELHGIVDLSVLKGWENLNIVTKTLTNEKYAALFFNTRKAPFSEKRFRQALAYAIEKPQKEERALGPIPPTSWAYNNNVKNYSFNLSRAKTLLKNLELGEGQNITITIHAQRNLMDWAEKIKSGWERGLGIKTEIIAYDNFEKVPQDFDILLGYGTADLDPDQYLFWHSTQEATNLTGYSNPRIDQLLEEGRRTIDYEQRKEIYRDFQRFLVEDAPAVFLFYPKVYNVMR